MFTLKFSTANDAFSDDAPNECARILRALADGIESRNSTILTGGGIIRDANGNTVGNWSLD